GTASESYSYFADGALHTASTSDGGTWTYAYNRRRLPTSESLAIGNRVFTIGYTYTALGHTSSQSLPGGLNLSFNPNALGQPRQAGGYASGVTWHLNGQLAGFTYGNGLIHSQTLNSRGLPNRIRDRSGAASRLDYTYSYDRNGNITHISDPTAANPWSESRTLAYDGRDRMTVATAPDIYGEEVYAYDALDNVRRMAGYPDGAGSYVLDYNYQYAPSGHLMHIEATDQITSWDFAHDGFGQTLARSAAYLSSDWSYQWNAAGRMTRATRTAPANRAAYVLMPIAELPTLL